MARAPRPAAQGLAPVLTLRLAHQRLRWWTLAVAGPVLLFVGLLQLVLGSFPTWIGFSLFWLLRLPSAAAMLGAPPPKVMIAADRCQVVHDGFFTAPVTVTRAQLHSIVPIYLRPVKRSPVRPTSIVPTIGDPGTGRGAALVFVFREERELRQARSGFAAFGSPSRSHPVRGLVLVVDDLDEAQRAFQSWGLLARMTPDAMEWLAPRSKVRSPGFDPIYGT